MYINQAKLAGTNIEVQCYNWPFCQHASSKSYSGSKEITHTCN
jgi:hypothetical protein